MQFRLRSLLIALALGPILLAIGWITYPVWLAEAWACLWVAIAAQGLAWLARRCSFFG